MSKPFALDPLLARDSLPLRELPLCSLRLMDDSRYPWLLLIPRQAGLSEAFELPSAQQQQLWQECLLVASALKQVCAADKTNIANLGNVVSQLHVHVIARFHGDDAWPGPVWGRHPALPYGGQMPAWLDPLLAAIGNAGSAE